MRAGPLLSEARSASGAVVNATVRVRLVDIDFAYIPYYPPEDMWLHWSEAPGTVDGCVQYSGFAGGVFLADRTTDTQGWTDRVSRRRALSQSSSHLTG